MAKLDISFVDIDDQSEGSVDNGGPSREFFRLLMSDIMQCELFEGPAKSKNLRLSAKAMEDKKYILVGMGITLSLIHGGPAPRFFSKNLFKLVSNQTLTMDDLDLTDVSDAGVQSSLRKIHEAKSLEQAVTGCTEATEFLTVLGCCRPLKSLADKDCLIKEAIWSYVVSRTTMAMDQFRTGLNVGGLLTEAAGHAPEWSELFVCETKPYLLTAKSVTQLFKGTLSEEGSNKRMAERRTLSFWRDWLVEVEGDEVQGVRLQQVLIFSTGADSEPPLGFESQPTLDFNHFSTDYVGKRYPTANTCTLTLVLPVTITYEQFSASMQEGIIMAPCFGQL